MKNKGFSSLFTSQALPFTRVDLITTLIYSARVRYMLTALYASSFVIFSTALGYVYSAEMRPRKGKLLAWGTRLVVGGQDPNKDAFSS